MKTSFFGYFRYIFAIFLQFSFAPYLTSACPARRSFRMGSDASAAGGRFSELSEWQRSIKSRKSESPKILSGTATGKLVGAVTHVLVNDPQTGYGIIIENMLKAAS